MSKPKSKSKSKPKSKSKSKPKSKSKSESECQAFIVTRQTPLGPDQGFHCKGKVPEYGLPVPVYLTALCLACILDRVQKSCRVQKFCFNGWRDHEGCISSEFTAFIKFLIHPDSKIPVELQGLAKIVTEANNLEIGKTYQATVDHSIKGCLTEVRVCKLLGKWHLELTIDGSSSYVCADDGYNFVICSE